MCNEVIADQLEVRHHESQRDQSCPIIYWEADYLSGDALFSSEHPPLAPDGFATCFPQSPVE